MGIEPIKRVKALIVRQWASEWDQVHFSDGEHRRRPEPHFYLFNIPAWHLKKLANIYRRKADKPRILDTGIQRALDKKRIDEIERFIHGGYPWSELSTRQKESNEYRDLRMPGWLPTAIIVNIISEGTTRDGKMINSDELIRIEKNGDDFIYFILPDKYLLDSWKPDVYPMEIIDGQHRLYAFGNNKKLDSSYYLPVVAFYDLDITWQAYLFYTINIKPKRINISLAYDLYPLLRIQDWLEKSPDGPVVYRETRAQELTEILWSHPESPWKNRINMLGEKKGGDVTQAAFIRSLLASYVKRGKPIGGLFGEEIHTHRGDPLKWNRIQQGAFLIVIWKRIKEAIQESDEPWTRSLRNHGMQLKFTDSEILKKDAAFSGENSLLATDQGVRGILQITNDMCYLAAEQLSLNKWNFGEEERIDALGENEITSAIISLENHSVNQFLKLLSQQISKFDWRTSSTPNLSDSERRNQMVYKGGSGYKEIRLQLLKLLTSSNERIISETANKVLRELNY